MKWKSNKDEITALNFNFYLGWEIKLQMFAFEGLAPPKPTMYVCFSFHFVACESSFTTRNAGKYQRPYRLEPD